MRVLTKKEFKDLIEEYDGTLLKVDGFDDCCVGLCARFGQEDIIAYSFNHIIKKLINQGMDEEEAVEYFYYNIIGAWVGELTPCFIKVY